jgi:hypothetical protein
MSKPKFVIVQADGLYPVSVKYPVVAAVHDGQRARKCGYHNKAIRPFGLLLEPLLTLSSFA